jgi:hypothetical protein
MKAYGGVDVQIHIFLKKKFLTVAGLELRPLVVQPVASRYTDWAVPAPCESVKMPNNK